MTTVQIGTDVRIHDLKTVLLAISWNASGRSCDLSTQSRFSVGFLGSRANSESLPKFRIALLAFRAALPMITSKFRPNAALINLNQNVALL
jgi:hypothetical protein